MQIILQGHQPQTIKLVFVASPLSMLH